MAKQAVGPIVRHVEKVVLGVCAVGFLYVVAMYGVVSPNKVGPDDRKMGPAEVDRRVLAEAESVCEKLRQFKPPTEPYEDPTNELQEIVDPLRLAGVSPTLVRSVSWGLPEPTFGAIPIGETHGLAQVVTLGKPLVGTQLAGRSGVYLSPPEPFDSTGGRSRDAAFLADVNWVTVSAIFDLQQQRELCRQAGYEENRLETIFLGMDVQRRTVNEDGTVSDWADINAYSGRSRATYPNPVVYKDEGGFNVADENRADVRAFYDLIRDPDAQLTMMRPLFPELDYGDNWQYPRDLDFDLLDMDCDYQLQCECRYPECATPQDSRIDTSGKSLRQLAKEAEKELDKSNFPTAMVFAEAALKMAERDKDRDALERLLDNIRQAQLVAKQAGRGDAQPVQLLWAHDCGIGSLLGGRTYQYRCRGRLYNRYCGTPTLLKDPKDAERVELVGPWSEPSDLIAIPQDTLVFLKSSKPQRRECRVEVFKWFAGEWVVASFRVAVGDRIGEFQKVDTPRGMREPVNFDTGATVIDIDFRRPYLARPRRGNRPQQKETTAMIFVDAAGKLHEHLLDLDKSSQLYKIKKSEVWKPARGQ